MKNKYEKVCHISSHHSPQSVRIFKKQCVSLVKAGYDVTYVVPGEGNPVNDGVKFIYVSNETGYFQRLFVKPFRVYSVAKRANADLYHIHDPELLIYGYILKINKKKVIYDIHEDVGEKIKDTKKALFKPFLLLLGFLFSRLEQQLARGFSHNITVNQDIEKKFIGAAISVITNYPIVDLFSKEAKENINEKPVVVYAGLLNRIRGIKEVIEAIGLLKCRAKLILLGKWQDKTYYEECRKSVGWQFTEYLGMMSLEDTYQIIEGSDIGVVNFFPLSNHLNSMPNKAFEYMAAGKPMVMSNFPYWGELFSECALFAEPQKPESIADRLITLVDDKHLCREKGKNARKLIDTKFCWEAESRKLLEIYKRVVGDDKPS